MSTSAIPASLKALLYSHVHAYEELEILVMMQRTPDRHWTAPGVAGQLTISDDLAADALRALTDRGVLEEVEEGSVLRYHGPRAEFRAAAAELVAFYEQHRLEVVMQLSANSIERMRTGAMRAFADAFFIGKRRKDG
jgi:hypothetical protein